MLAGAGTIWGVSSICLAETTTGATIAGATTSAIGAAGVVPLTTASVATAG